MTTITKDRLLTIQHWRETYGPGSNVVLPAEEAEELARIALASLAAVSDERAAYELFMEKRFGESVDRRRAKNGDREYMAWDMALGWIIWCHRAAMLQSGNFRENKNSSTNNFREIAETSTNYPAIPSEVLSAILKVARIRADFDDFDGDRRGIGDCLDEAEQELIVTINKYASQLAAEPIAPNDVREQTAIPQVPVTPDGWISCSEQMPVIGELNWRTSFPLLITCEIGVIPAYYGFVSVNGDRHYGFMESLKYGDDSGGHPQTNEYGLISNVTHWMPLPEPPQEVNRG